MKFTILKNEDSNSHKRWEQGCINLKQDYNIIDLTAPDWYEQIVNDDSDCFLLKPPGETLKYKSLYDERLWVISKVMARKIYPSFEEVVIYENKRMLSFFLKGAGIPHPETAIFYEKKKALKFIENCELPVVGKTAIGASGSGVKIFRSRQKLRQYVNSAFGKGIRRHFGPNRNTGNITSWSRKAYANPSFALKKFKKYLNVYKDAQQGFVIFQEYIPHNFEWRIAKIGESWFGHQKVKSGDKASGTKGIDYVAPPFELLDFCRDLCDRNGFNNMAIDVFEHPLKGYVVNELQTVFGHVQKYIMKVHGEIGRYVYRNGWQFEAGDFNTNESYDLRLKHAIELLEKGEL